MDFKIELNKIEFDEYDEVDFELLYDFVDRLKALPNNREAISAIFNFIESNHDKQLGSPGPLVHFLEEKNDYYDALKQSSNRKPTALTMWMINRIINAASDTDKAEWLSILEHASKNEAADEIAREEANRFLEYQRD